MIDFKLLKLITIPYKVNKLESGLYYYDNIVELSPYYGQLCVSLEENLSLLSFYGNRNKYVKFYLISNDSIDVGDYFLFNNKVYQCGEVEDSIKGKILLPIGGDENHGWILQLTCDKIIVMPEQIGWKIVNDPNDIINNSYLPFIGSDFPLSKIGVKDLQTILDNDGKCEIQMQGIVNFKVQENKYDHLQWEPKLFDNRIIINIL